MNYTKPEVYEFISKKTSDPIVEWKTCEVSGEKFPIFQSDLDFYDKVSPIFGGKKYSIPTPRLCPEERERRRMAWRNERFLFRRKNDATGEEFISMYTPDTTFPVYDNAVWWGDFWNPFGFGFSVSQDVSFKEQFGQLVAKVPMLYSYNINSQNSDYSNCALDMKDCYLVSGAIGDENCYYGNYMDYCNYCVDNLMIFDSELCYECVDCKKCYNCQYCWNTINSKNSYFLYSCQDCHHCFGCVNLVGKSYCYFNQQMTKKDYEDKLSHINLGSYKKVEEVKEYFVGFYNRFPKLVCLGHNNENCIGNNPLYNSKNCFKCFDASDLENCKYLYWFRHAKNCYDVFSRGSPGELMYECVSVGNGVTNCIGCTNLDNSNYCYYSIQCSNSHHLFGCDGLNNAKYCIFNKQYDKIEWEKLVAGLIEKMMKNGEWGEMLDPALSVYGYNYSVAQEFFPLTELEAKEKGFVWSSFEKPVVNNVDGIIKGGLSDSIQDVDDSILKKIIQCDESGKYYKITKQELDFYRKNVVPLPRKHPDIRHEERLKQRPDRELYLRGCDKCGKEMLSVYSKLDISDNGSLSPQGGQHQKVYCEECYNAEVY